MRNELLVFKVLFLILFFAGCGGSTLLETYELRQKIEDLEEKQEAINTELATAKNQLQEFEKLAQENQLKVEANLSKYEAEIEQQAQDTETALVVLNKRVDDENARQDTDVTDVANALVQAELIANNSQIKADLAIKSATEAQNLANQANAKATTADNKAIAAQSSANTAQNTANNAATKIELGALDNKIGSLTNSLNGLPGNTAMNTAIKQAITDEQIPQKIKDEIDAALANGGSIKLAIDDSIKADISKKNINDKKDLPDMTAINTAITKAINDIAIPKQITDAINAKGYDLQISGLDQQVRDLNGDVSTRINQAITDANIVQQINTAITAANVPKQINDAISQAGISQKITDATKDFATKNEIKDFVTKTYIDTELAKKADMGSIPDLNDVNKVLNDIRTADYGAQITAIKNDYALKTSLPNLAPITDDITLIKRDYALKTDMPGAANLEPLKNDIIAIKNDYALKTSLPNLTSINDDISAIRRDYALKTEVPVGVDLAPVRNDITAIRNEMKDFVNKGFVDNAIKPVDDRVKAIENANFAKQIGDLSAQAEKSLTEAALLMEKGYRKLVSDTTEAFKIEIERVNNSVKAYDPSIAISEALKPGRPIANFVNIAFDEITKDGGKIDNKITLATETGIVHTTMKSMEDKLSKDISAGQIGIDIRESENKRIKELENKRIADLINKTYILSKEAQSLDTYENPYGYSEKDKELLDLLNELKNQEAIRNLYVHRAPADEGGGLRGRIGINQGDPLILVAIKRANQPLIESFYKYLLTLKDTDLTMAKKYINEINYNGDFKEELLANHSWAHDAKTKELKAKLLKFIKEDLALPGW